MSTMQRLTLIGLYNYDNTLFDNVTLPDDYDRDLFINTLLLEHGEKCVLYTDVDFMKFSLGVVSSKWQLELEKLYEALTADYDPVSNYDRYESTGEKRKVEADYDSTATPDSKETTQVITPEVTERKVSAYDSSTYEPSEETTVKQGKSEVARSGKDIVNVKGKLADETRTYNSHVYGNIGVTTATKMVNEVIDQRTSKNLYSLAARIFANELLLYIY